MNNAAPPAHGGLTSNIPVKFKVLMGFGVILVIMAAMSGLGYFNFATVGHEVDLYAENVEEAALAEEIELTFLRTRLHAREYLATDSEEDAKAVDELAGEMSALLVKAEALFQKPDRREKVTAIKTAFETYISDFAKAKKFEDDYLKLVKTVLEPNGEKITEDLHILLKQAVEEGNSDAKNYVESALFHGAQMRLYASIALERHDSHATERTMGEFHQLTNAVEAIGKAARTPEERQLQEELLGLIEAYEKAFEKSEEDLAAIQELSHGEMQQAAQEIANDTAWLLEQATQSEQQIREETITGIQSAEATMLIISLVGIAIGLALGWLIGAGIAKPIVRMTGAMTTLAGGDLSVHIPAQGRGDEIGEMAGAVQVFKDTAIRTKEMEAEQQEQKRRAEEERKKLLNSMADDFEANVGGVVSTVSSASTEMESSATSLSATADQTSQQATTVAAAAEEASTNVQTVASAAEELSSSISEISRQVSQSTQISNTAVAEVQGANEKVQGLAEAANKIGEVVALITDIADQTNLLALNATIEAARAGEAGKGFAVVASEVKNLANQTAKATEEISNQIGDIQGATEEAVSAIGSIGNIISQMNEISATIAAAVEEQGAATQEIARNVEQAAAGTGEVSSNISGVTQASSETGANASQMLGAAKELSQQAETLRSEVDNFLHQVRQG